VLEFSGREKPSRSAISFVVAAQTIAGPNAEYGQGAHAAALSCLPYGMTTGASNQTFQMTCFQISPAAINHAATQTDAYPESTPCGSELKRRKAT